MLKLYHPAVREHYQSMDHELLLKIFRDAISAIQEPRFFKSERGYQGALVAELTKRLPDADLDGSPIVEQEHQKRLVAHGITIRPDLIVHIPFERTGEGSRREGNFVAVEIKRRSTAAEAREDFLSLTAMKEMLGYPLTIFLNVDSSVTHADSCPQGIAHQTTCFAVILRDGEPVIAMDRCSALEPGTG